MQDGSRTLPPAIWWRIERIFEPADKKQEQGMPEELAFKDEAAAEYDRAFAHVTAYFMPFLSYKSALPPY